MMTMSVHVSDKQLEKLIDDGLAPDERLLVERHLDSCETCLSKLAAHADRLAASVLSSDDDASSRTGAEDEQIQRVSQHLRLAVGSLLDPSPTVPAELEFVGSIGGGGFGEVFEYRDRTFGRSVAVKVLHARHAGDPGSSARFRQEMELTALIDHPGCPAVHGGGRTSDGRDFFWMQLVSGPRLADVIAGFGRERRRGLTRANQELRSMLDTFRQICHTIQAAHERGILHRDLKPANIRVHRDGHPIVLDWGLAKRQGAVESAVSAEETAAASPFSQDGTPFGTPGYMSPEQARGDRQDVGRATDIYGLGGILYEMLCGTPPHQSLVERLADRRRVSEAIAAGHIPTMAGLPGELASICRRALAAEPRDRYDSAAALAADVERWLAGVPVAAHEYGVVEKSALFVRRRPLLSLGVGFAALLLLAAGLTIQRLAAVAAIEGQAAKQRYELSLQAYQEMVAVVKEELVNVGQSAEARQRLLAHAIKGIEELVASAERGRGAELVALEGRLQLAHYVRLERGDLSAALDQYQAALRDLEQLSPEQGQRARYFKLLLDATNGVTLCVEARDGPAKAQPWHDAWHARAEQFYREFPESPPAKMARSQSLVRRAAQAESRGKDGWDQSEQLLWRAREVLEDLPPEIASDPVYLYEKLTPVSGLARIKAAREEWPEAIRLQRQVVAEMDQVVAKAPNLDHQLGALVDGNSLGVFLKQGGHSSEAVTSLEQTLRRAEQLAEAFPDHQRILRQRDDLRHHLATAYRADGKTPQAIETLKSLLRSDVDPANADLADVVALAISHAALARAYKDASSSADSCRHLLTVIELRRAVWRRDATMLENVNDLLVAAQTCGRQCGETPQRQETLRVLGELCSQLDGESVRQWPDALRFELAAVCYYYGMLQAARTGSQDVQPDPVAARRAFEMAKKWMLSLATPSPDLFAEIDKQLAALK